MTPFTVYVPRVLATAALLLVSAAAPAAAQDGAPPAAAAPSAPRPRASWLSDRIELRAGDIVTVIVDERASAREWVSETGDDRRSLLADISTQSNGTESMGATGVDSRWDASSRQVGEANRQGGLYAVVSARVVSVEPSGLARIEGKKTVSIDGRNQEMTLNGMIRPQDIRSGNVVLSSSIADAVVTYKGKKLGPRRGILGKVLSMLWPF